MASISKDKNGTKRLVFNDHNGKRHFVRLGAVNVKQAELVKSRVEAMTSAKIMGVALDAETSRWLVDIGDDLHEKLSKAGLIKARKAVILEKYIPAYIEQLDNSKDTKTNKLQTAKTLFAFFGENRNPATISEKEAKDYRSFLLSHRMDRKGQMVKSDSVKPSIVWKRLQHVNEFFKAMLDESLVEVNPFKKVKQRPNYGEERKVYIPAEDFTGSWNTPRMPNGG